MRVNMDELKAAYANTPMNRGQRIDWLLTRRDELDVVDEDSLQEFEFIGDEVCRLIGARLCILATKKELSDE